MDYLRHELDKIKEGKPSFLGIDGGNINSDVWFCGIEFGGTLGQMEGYYNTIVKSYKIADFNLEIPYRENAGDFEKSSYDLYLSELVIKLFGLQNTNRFNYLKDKLYNKDSKIFKLNLYPLAKKDTSWDTSITKEFSILKEDYYGKYFDNRKLFFKELIEKFKPKKIICTAIKHSELQFVEAFFGDKARFNYKKEIVKFEGENGTKKSFKITQFDNGLFSLIIIPFPGMGIGNLNSYLDVRNMSKYLKNHYL